MVASAGYVSRVAITVVAPGIIAEFHLTPAQMGTIFSAFLLGYTLCQVPSGVLADRVGARRIFLALCAGWACLSVLTAFVGWQSVTVQAALVQFWIIRALFGVVSAPTYPTSGRTISVSVPPTIQARANSLVLASVGIGSAVTPIVLAPLANAYGWRAAMAAAGLVCIAAGLIWWRFAPSP